MELNTPAYRLTRRTLVSSSVTIFGAALGMALLQACGGSSTAPGSPTSSAASLAPTTAPAGVTPAAAPPTAASGASPTAAPAQTTPLSTGPVSLRFTARAGGQSDYFKERGDAFTKINPNVTIKHEPFPGGDAEYYPKILALAAAHNQPDVFWASIGRSSYQWIATKNVLQDLGPIIGQQKYDLGQFYPNAVESLKVNGKLYGLPWITHPGRSGVYFNEDAWKKAELPLPDENYTFDKLTQDGDKMVKAGMQFAFAGSYGSTDDFLSVLVPVRAYGGDVLSKDGKTCLLNSKEALAAVQWMNDMVYKFKLSPIPSQGQQSSGDLFAAAKLASYQSGYWGQFSPTDTQIAGKFTRTSTMMPKGPAGVHGSMFEVDTVCMSPGTKTQDPSFAFMSFACNKESGILAATAASVPGARPDVWNSPELMSRPMHVVMKKLIESAGAFVGPANYQGEKFNTVMSQLMSQIWLAQATPDQALPNITKQLQAILDQPMQQ